MKLIAALRKVRQRLEERFEPPVPAHLRKNFHQADESGLDTIRAALECHYFAQCPAGYLASDCGKRDYQNHVLGRLQTDRNLIIPWLDDARPLRGARVLEIGCGTGASTVALAEQGAEVTGIDIAEEPLEVARVRCRAYGVEASLLPINAVEVSRALAGRTFDVVIFFASLEHMTHSERLRAMKGTWEMLPPGGLWCVAETPNRLWHFDFHTSRLPFFLWLPDDLALAYAQFSPRADFREAMCEDVPDRSLRFLRLGRGVSFHEFDLSMERASALQIVSSLSAFRRRRNLVRALAWRLSPARRFQRFLMRASPGVHPAFFDPWLEVIIRKEP